MNSVYFEYKDVLLKKTVQFSLYFAGNITFITVSIFRKDAKTSSNVTKNKNN